MLLSFWSPKAGAGTSVFAAALASHLGRARDVRLVDLAGDQAAIVGVDGEAVPGATDWLRAGPLTPADAVGRLEIEAAPQLRVLPHGTRSPWDASPEAGAALARVLVDDERCSIADCGTADAPSVRALVEVSDVSVVVVRGCYLALRRATRDPLVRRAAGMVFLREAGRGLHEREVESVLELPTLASVPYDAAIARAIDAGVVLRRTPAPLARAVRQFEQRLGTFGRRGRAA